jgi:hypothetical protein
MEKAKQRNSETAYTFRGKKYRVEYLGKSIETGAVLQPDGSFKPVVFEAKSYRNLDR